jgi:hypothetical protein
MYYCKFSIAAALLVVVLLAADWHDTYLSFQLCLYRVHDLPSPHLPPQPEQLRGCRNISEQFGRGPESMKKIIRWQGEDANYLLLFSYS